MSLRRHLPLSSTIYNCLIKIKTTVRKYRRSEGILAEADRLKLRLIVMDVEARSLRNISWYSGNDERQGVGAMLTLH